MIVNVTTGPESVAVQEASGMWLIQPLAHRSPFPYMRPVRWLAWLWIPFLTVLLGVPTVLVGLIVLKIVGLTVGAIVTLLVFGLVTEILEEKFG